MHHRIVYHLLAYTFLVNTVDSYSVPLTEEQRLVRYLTTNYSRIGKPGAMQNVPLIVQARFFPIKMQNLVEKDEALQMSVRIQLNWKDPSLTFDSAAYNNQTSVILPGGSIWIPDLQISNSMSDLYGLLRDSRFDFKVYNDGAVWWHPTGNIATRCEIMLQYFPFDYQRCPIILESVIYTHSQLNLTLRYDKTPWSKSMYVESGHWDLVAIKARSRLKYVTNSTAFTSVEFWIFLGRKSGYYKLNIIFPCGMLSALQMLTFFLPLESSERVPEATTILLSVIVFQSMIIQDLPRSSDALPLLCVYIDLLTAISVISVGEAVLIAYLVSRKEERRFCPTWAIPLLKTLYRLRNKEPVYESADNVDLGDKHWRHRPSYRQPSRYSLSPMDYELYDPFHRPHARLHHRGCIACHDDYLAGRLENNCPDLDCTVNDAAVAGGGTIIGGYRSYHGDCCYDYCNHHRPMSNSEAIAFLRNGGRRANGACYPSESETPNKADIFDKATILTNEREVIDNSKNSALSENLKLLAGRGATKPIRQPSHSSSCRLRPVLLAPLAKLDAGSDIDSSDFELSQHNFTSLSKETSAAPLSLMLDAMTTDGGNNDQVFENGIATSSFTRACSSSVPLTMTAKEASEVTAPSVRPNSLHQRLITNNDDSGNINPIGKPTKNERRGTTTSPFSSLKRKHRQQENADRRRVNKRLAFPTLLVDWVFLAKVVDFVAFVCCLSSITGVPIFLFYFVPPDSPDFNLESHLQ